MTWLALVVAGGVGAVLRDRVAHALAARRHGYVTATTVVNLVGAFALGLLVGREVTASTLAVLGTGVLGGLTTFSTWLTQAVFLRDRRLAGAVVVGPLVLGPLLVAAGVALGGRL